MLNVPNLDNQRFEETLEAAVRRIPYLFPEWTDYNEHDPGITLLELFVWYKQMQQYHLDQVTDRNREMFFKLLGLYRRGMEPGRLVMALNDRGPEALCAGTPLSSDAGVPYELTAGVEPQTLRVERLYSLRRDGVYDVTELLGTASAFALFGNGEGGRYDDFLIGLSSKDPLNVATLWFGVEREGGRNPFAPDSPDPRTVLYEAMGPKGPRKMDVLLDETHALSRSGRVVLRCETPLEESDGEEGLPKLRYIRLSLPDPGCEETPRASVICAGFAAARQTVTLAETHGYTQTGSAARCHIDTYLARTGGADVFLRDEAGWYPAEYTRELGEEGLTVGVKLPAGLADDGEENLRVVCYDPSFRRGMRRDLTGLPCERIQLPSQAGRPVAGEMLVMCAQRDKNGRIRLQDWRHVDSLYKAGPRECRFEIDYAEEELCFGDNANGRCAPKGEKAFYIAALAYSLGEGGGVTAGAPVYVNEDDAQPLGRVLEYVPGRGEESIEAMAQRLNRLLREPSKAVTAADCEAIALRTPGISIQSARALPAFSPASKRIGEAPAHVTMVVAPRSAAAFPRPDERFLAQVQKQMEAHRTICTCMHVMGPAYVGVNVWAEIVIRKNEAEAAAGIEAALREHFDFKKQADRLGAPVRKSEVSAAVGGCAQVLGLLQLELRSGAPGCKKTAQGDIEIPPYAIAYLTGLEVHTTLS